MVDVGRVELPCKTYPASSTTSFSPFNAWAGVLVRQGWSAYPATLHQPVQSNRGLQHRQLFGRGLPFSRFRRGRGPWRRLRQPSSRPTPALSAWLLLFGRLFTRTVDQPRLALNSGLDNVEPSSHPFATYKKESETSITLSQSPPPDLCAGKLASALRKSGRP